MRSLNVEANDLQKNGSIGFAWSVYVGILDYVFIYYNINLTLSNEFLKESKQWNKITQQNATFFHLTRANYTLSLFILKINILPNNIW
jgi:hypothetical protein